ncbi:MAG: DUF4153 domain-containing protein, partial [Maribacter sp.]|nr:DUF4153 domain-containing protein [Maribacter sp.]
FSRKKQLKVLPITLCLLALLSSFGFWGAFSISKNSQVNQFQKVFGAVEANDRIATNEQYDRLKSIVDYLAEGRSLQRLDEIVGFSTNEFYIDTSAGSMKTYVNNVSHKLLDSLGIGLDIKKIGENNNGKFFTYYSPENTNYTYAIADYEHFTQISFNDHDNYKMKIGEFDLLYHQKNKTVSFFSQKDSSLVHKVAIGEKLFDLTKYGTEMKIMIQNDLVLDSENKQISVKFIFTELGYQILNDSIQLNQARSFLFLKQK